MEENSEDCISETAMVPSLKSDATILCAAGESQMPETSQTGISSFPIETSTPVPNQSGEVIKWKESLLARAQSRRSEPIVIPEYGTITLENESLEKLLTEQLPDVVHSYIENPAKRHEDCNILLVNGNKKVPCHTEILMAYAPSSRGVFKDKPKALDAEPMPRHNMQWADGNVLPLLIETLYNGCSKLNLDEAKQLLEISTKYGFQYLTQRCVALCLGHVNIENAVETKILAVTATNRSLSIAVDEFILRNLSDLLASPAFADLSLEHILRLMDACSSIIPDEAVSAIVDTWISKKQRHDNSNLIIQIETAKLYRHARKRELSIFDGKPQDVALPCSDDSIPGWVFLSSLITPKAARESAKACGVVNTRGEKIKVKLIDEPHSITPAPARDNNKRKRLDTSEEHDAKIPRTEESSTPRASRDPPPRSPMFTSTPSAPGNISRTSVNNSEAAINTTPKTAAPAEEEDWEDGTVDPSVANAPQPNDRFAGGRGGGRGGFNSGGRGFGGNDDRGNGGRGFNGGGFGSNRNGDSDDRRIKNFGGDRDNGGSNGGYGNRRFEGGNRDGDRDNGGGFGNRSFGGGNRDDRDNGGGYGNRGFGGGNTDGGRFGNRSNDGGDGGYGGRRSYGSDRDDGGSRDYGFGHGGGGFRGGRDFGSDRGAGFGGGGGFRGNGRFDGDRYGGARGGYGGNREDNGGGGRFNDGNRDSYGQRGGRGGYRGGRDGGGGFGSNSNAAEPVVAKDEDWDDGFSAPSSTPSDGVFKKPGAPALNKIPETKSSFGGKTSFGGDQANDDKGHSQPAGYEGPGGNFSGGREGRSGFGRGRDNNESEESMKDPRSFRSGSRESSTDRFGDRGNDNGGNFQSSGRGRGGFDRFGGDRGGDGGYGGRGGGRGGGSRFGDRDGGNDRFGGDRDRSFNRDSGSGGDRFGGGGGGRGGGRFNDGGDRFGGGRGGGRFGGGDSGEGRFGDGGRGGGRGGFGGGRGGGRGGFNGGGGAPSGPPPEIAEDEAWD